MCVISIFEMSKVICIKNTEWVNFDCTNLSLLNSRIVKVLKIDIKNYYIVFYFSFLSTNFILNKGGKRI